MFCLVLIGKSNFTLKIHWEEKKITDCGKNAQFVTEDKKSLPFSLMTLVYLSFISLVGGIKRLNSAVKNDTGENY